MQNIPADQNVAALFVFALIYGIYLTTFVVCLRWLAWSDEGWKLRKDIHWGMLLATVLLFGFSLTNLSLALQTTMESVRQGNNPPPSTPHRPSLEAVVVCTTANISALIADLVLIHRLWTVFGKPRLIAIFPLILWMGGIVCTALQAYVQIVQRAQLRSVWLPVNMTIGPGTILTPFWGSTVVSNAYCTGLIVYRIWNVTKDERGEGSIQLRFLMRVLIESGFFYLAIAVSHFVVWWTTDDFAIVFISYINLPVIGITFNLIHIRTYKYRASEQLAKTREPRVSSLAFVPPSTMKTTIGVGAVAINLTDSIEV